MAFSKEDRTGAFGAPTPSRVGEKHESARRADEKALRRYQIARAASSVKGSLTAKRQHIAACMVSGFIAPGNLPSKGTISDLCRRWDEGFHDINDYAEKLRPGRPRDPIDRAFEEAVAKEINKGRAVNVRLLATQLEERARLEGRDAPTYYQVHRRVARAGRLRRSAARYGSRAAEFDGLPHPRFACRFSHQTWVLDEFRSPVWVKLHDPSTNEWVSCRPSIILIIDLCSTAVVGYFVSNPTERIDEDGVCFRTGFNADDVMAALLSAACAELATDATRPFAGYMPRRLRWDNAKAHKFVQDRKVAAGIEMEISPIRVRRAISNGSCERRNAILKSHCAGMHGHVDDYLPIDAIPKSAGDLGVERSATTSSSNERQVRYLPVLPEDLMTLEEFRAEFDRVVARYNERCVNRMFKLTPLQKYHRDMEPRRQRNGRSLLHLVDAHTSLVTTDGIVHTHRGMPHKYHPLVEDALLLLDTMVTYYADPAGRGLFLRTATGLHFVEPKFEWSSSESAIVARNSTAIARALSVEADALRRAELAGRVGYQGVKAAQEQYELALQGLGEITAPPATLTVSGDAVLIEPDADTSSTFLNQWAMGAAEDLIDGLMNDREA